MAFVLSKAPRTVKEWPVMVPVSIDGGEVQISKITVDMNILFSEDFDARVADAKAALAAAQKAGTSLEVDREVLKSIVTGWSGIVDEEGADVPFSQDALAMLARNQNALSAIYDAYFDAVRGKAAAKN